MNNDLISRSTLKEEFEKIYPLATNEMGGFVNKKIYDIIDNAQTVEAFTKEDMSGAYNEGYACGSRESERPNGKIVKDYIPYVDDDGNLRTFERYVCSECRESVPSISKFCLHCGIEFER